MAINAKNRTYDEKYTSNQEYPKKKTLHKGTIAGRNF